MARDFKYYLETLREFKDELHVKVHAYCVMHDHVHLLVTPADANGVSRLMKQLAGRQTRFHNRLERRSGTLWEGRYRSSPVDPERYLLACCRFIELNPVRTKVVTDPLAYRWSSCRPRFELHEGGDWLDPDTAYLGLGATCPQRQARYKQYLRQPVPEGEWDLIREAARRGQLTGGEDFSDAVAGILGRRIVRRGPGRPPRAVEPPVNAFPAMPAFPAARKGNGADSPGPVTGS